MDGRNRVRRGYDTLADAYAERRTESDRERRILGAFLDGVADGARVLDAGCGQGTPVLRRLDAVAHAVGLDFSQEQLRLASDAVPRAALVQGDLTGLPFSRDAFDAVVASNAVIHVPVADHPRVFAEFARVLRPGGRLLVSEGEEAFERTNPDWLGEDREMTWHMAGVEATKEHLRDAGFEIGDVWEASETEAATPPFFAARLD